MIDERRKNIVELLRARSSRLGAMYNHALQTLNEASDTDLNVARVSVISHCMREIMTNLPAVMADSFEPRPKPSSSALLSKLPGLLAKHPDLDVSEEHTSVIMPGEIARAILAVASTVVREQGRNIRNSAALLNNGEDKRQSAVRQWDEAYQFFVRWAHLDRHEERGSRLPTDEDLMMSIRVVEDAVEVVSSEFFENLSTVQDLLSQINSIAEEDKR